LEKAVKYSEEQGAGEVTFSSLKKVLREMKIELPITPHSIKKVQQPDGFLAQARSTGMPSEKRVKEHLSSLRDRIRKDQEWLVREKRGIERAKVLVSRMEDA
jgi:hypothetical protein